MAFPALLAMLALAGCGGGVRSGSSATGTSGLSGSAGEIDTNDGAMIGSWSGTYRAADGSQSGTISFTIARDSTTMGADSRVRVTGTAQDSRYGAATVTGFVYDRDYPLGESEDYGGLAGGYVSASGVGLAYASGNDSFVGIPSLDGSGHLVATLGKFTGGDVYPATFFNLSRVVAQ